jgi:CelD/BcsL family acetyltransferase involved in cellulose biosynthesis
MNNKAPPDTQGGTGDAKAKTPPMPVEVALELFASLESLPEIAAGFESVRRTARAERLAGEAEFHSGKDALDAASADWRAIEREVPPATPFQTLAFAEAALPAHLAHGHTPHIIVVRDHGAPVAILPLVAAAMAGSRVLRFLGDPLIQYGDAIVARGSTDAHLAQALAAAATLGADAALFRKVRSDAKIAPLLSRRAQIARVEEAPYVDLRRDGGLNPRDARELRRYRRRLADRGEIQLVVTRGAEALNCVRTALDLKRNWLETRGFTSSVIGDEHWEATLFALAAARDSTLACARLEAGGRLAGIEIALLHGKRWHAFLGAIAPEFAKCGPGQVQMAETIAQARAEGFAAYDLLAPADPFKRVMATGAISVCDYALPLSLQGQLTARAFRFAPQAKSLLAKLPSPLRGGVARLLRLR